MHGTYGNFGNNVNSKVHQGQTDCDGRDDFSLKQSEPSIASGIDRLRETGKQAHEIRSLLQTLVGRLRAEPTGSSGSASSEPKASGMVPDMHSALDVIGYALDDIASLVRRLEALHG